MFRFNRRFTIRTATDMPAAVQHAAAHIAYVNQHYGLNMQLGVELFGANAIHTFVDFESLDKVVELTTKLGQDSSNQELMAKSKPFTVEGSIKDTVVRLIA